LNDTKNNIPDILEYGAPTNGQAQTTNERLYIQLNVFTSREESKTKDITKCVIAAIQETSLDSAIYLNANDPSGIGVLFLSDNPESFVSEVRTILSSTPFNTLKHRNRMTMLGRTYSMGYEPDLKESLFLRPRRTILNPEWPWVIWYPLRRNGAFARLDNDAQRKILMEHAHIGRAYGTADLAHDIRLACYGLDEADNDFVIGLIGKALYPLSRVVQDMRKTQQTALYIDSLGPFFVGKKIWSSNP
tara:strand:+ start:23643 stop:24380 length:738 start_codon:yes stop_codon:yes gene_type:complete